MMTLRMLRFMLLSMAKLILEMMWHLFMVAFRMLWLVNIVLLVEVTLLFILMIVHWSSLVMVL